MGKFDILKSDTDAYVKPRCRTFRSYVNRLLRKLDESVLNTTAAP